MGIIKVIKDILFSNDKGIKNFRAIIFKIIIIFLISVAIGILLHLIFQFSEETLLWMTSTIVQAFGALIAIVVIVGLREVELITHNFNVIRRQLPEQVTITNRSSREEIEEFNRFLEGLKRTVSFSNEQIENVRSRLYPILISILILIGISLSILIFVKGQVSITISLNQNLMLSIIFTFLLLLSIYSLYELVREIKRILGLKFQ